MTDDILSKTSNDKVTNAKIVDNCIINAYMYTDEFKAMMKAHMEETERFVEERKKNEQAEKITAEEGDQADTSLSGEAEEYSIGSE